MIPHDEHDELEKHEKHEIERLGRIIDRWDPASGDLPDEIALAMDAHDALRARFDARFARWAQAEPEAPPVDLEQRVLPRPRRRRWPWAASALAAAAALVVCGVGGSGLVLSSVALRADMPLSEEGPVVRTVSLLTPTELSALEALGYADTTVAANVFRHDKNAAGEGRFDLPATGDGFVDAGVSGVVDPRIDPLSTFSVDVDRGAYTFARRRLREGFLPDPAGVRAEEFVNALVYDYPKPESGPFAVHFEASPGPFDGRDTIVRVGVTGREVEVRKPVHLTFLVDTSGSMQGPDRLALVKQALGMLVSELGDGDTVAVVAYAGGAGVVLPPTSATDQRRILGAIGGLEAGGSTAMGQGIELAYRLALDTLRDGETSRVIIASDGDANVGVTSPDALTAMIRGYADRGVTLTTLGFGQGNYQDFRMEQLANDGDGNYFYIDSADEARRVFVDELASTLEVIARDVKIQVAWNPEAVLRYRLIGYENRAIADRDFRNDRVDAGEIGAGHTVTALYEVALRPGGADPIATVRLRAKPPGADAAATERTYTLPRVAVQPSFAAASPDHRMAVAMAAFAERLRASPHVEGVSYDRIAGLVAEAARPGHDEDQEVLELVRRAAALDPMAP